MVATATRVHRFVATGAELTLTRRQQVDGTNQFGQKVRVQDPVRYTFAPKGYIEIAEGQHVLPDGPGGTDQDLVSWLLAHPALGRRFVHVAPDGDELLPSEADFMEAVVEASVALDEPRLRALIDDERDGHGRVNLIEAAEKAHGKVLSAIHDPASGDPQELGG